MPKRQHTIQLDDKQLTELLTAVETQVDILNDTVTEDLFISRDDGSITFTKSEFDELRQEVGEKIDRLVAVQLLYAQLKQKVELMNLSS